jgi:uncharacterized protein (DUF2141 family)
MTIRRRLLGLSALFVLTGATPAPPSQPLVMDVEGLRSTRGRILICLTRRADHFPDCSRDPDRRHFSVPAVNGPVAFGDVAPGDYAIAIIHDENSNDKLDTFAAIPREGVGFSRNPVIRFGAPSFRSAQFTIAGAPVHQTVRLKYFL